MSNNPSMKESLARFRALGGNVQAKAGELLFRHERLALCYRVSASRKDSPRCILVAIKALERSK